MNGFSLKVRKESVNLVIHRLATQTYIYSCF